MLADILDVSRLCKKFVHLVADTELAAVSEITASKLLLDACKHLESTGVLRFSGLLRNTLWCVKDTTFQNGGTAAARGKVARLGTVLEINAFNNGLAAFCGERYSVWGLLCTKTPVDQGVVNELWYKLVSVDMGNVGCGTYSLQNSH